MAAGRWQSYHTVPLYTGNGTIDLERHTFRVHLFGPDSNAGDLTLRTLGELSGEVSESRTLPHSWEQDGERAVFGGSRVVWTAESDPIEARYAVVVRQGNVNGVTDALVAVCQLNMAGEVRVTPGNDLRLIISEMGIFAHVAAVGE